MAPLQPEAREDRGTWRLSDTGVRVHRESGRTAGSSTSRFTRASRRRARQSMQRPGRRSEKAAAAAPRRVRGDVG